MVSKNEFPVSKQPVALDSVLIKKIVVSNKVEHGDKGILYCLKWVDTWIILKTEEEICPLKLKIMSWYNIMEFRTEF